MSVRIICGGEEKRPQLGKWRLCSQKEENEISKRSGKEKEGEARTREEEEGEGERRSDRGGGCLYLITGLCPSYGQVYSTAASPVFCNVLCYALAML